MWKTFVPVDRVRGGAADFRWSDWDPYAAVGDPGKARREALGALSSRALVAYTLACAEWTVYQFHDLSPDPMPYLYLEALWVSVVDPRYAPPDETDEMAWKGPIRGSIDLALMTVLNAIGSAGYEDGKPEVDAALAERIARHVSADPAPFDAWKTKTLARLERHFSRSEDPGGTLGLPPQVFGERFTPSRLDAYVEAFLASVDFDDHPFLRALERR